MSQQNLRRSRVPVIPAVVAAMGRDPRVAAAQAAMASGRSTAPVTGMYDGLARALTGLLGGAMNRRYNMDYLRDQDQYMTDTRAAYNNVSGGPSSIPPLPQGVAPQMPPPAMATARSPVERPTTPLPPPMPQPPVPGPQPPMPQPPPMHQPGPPPVPRPAPVSPGDPGPATMPRISLDQPISNEPNAGAGAPLGDIARILAQMPADAATPIPGGIPGPPSVPSAVPPMARPAYTPPTAQPGMGADASILNPAMPGMPNVTTAQESTRRRLGSALINNGNPYSFSEGVENFNAGLDEDARNQAEARQRQFALESARYETQLNDYGSARGAARGAEYARQSDQRGFEHADAAQRRAFEHEFTVLERTQGFQASQADRERAFLGWQFRSQMYGQEMPGGPDAYGSVDQPGRFTVNGWTVGDGFGASRDGGSRIHQGLDTFAPAQAPFPYSGPIRIIESHRQTSGSGDGGNIATVEFPDGTRWMAMHLPNLPSPGTYAQGAEILRAGNTGNARNSAAHIHWQPANDQAHAIYNRGRAATMSYLTGQPVGPTPGAPGAPGARTVNIGPGAPGRPLPPRIEQEISASAQTTDQILGLSSRFRDDFTGYGADWAGHLALGAERRMGTNQDSVNWWADYNNMNNAVRHALFGSALTATEQEQWERSTVTPGTSAPNARHMLETQAHILQGALIRRARGSAAAGYNGGQIYELIGEDLVGRMGAPSGVQPGTPPAGQGRRVGANGGTYEQTADGRWTVVQAAPQPQRGGGAGRPGTRTAPGRYRGSPVPYPTMTGQAPSMSMPQQRPWFMVGPPPQTGGR